MTTQVNLAPGRVLRGLAAILLILLVLHVAGLISAHVLGHINLFGFVPMFDFDEEQNIPTWFSSMLLLAVSLILAAIAASKRRIGDGFARHWAGLAVIFFFLSLDEATSIHELLMYALGKVMEARGALHFAWVIVYLPLAIAIAVVYLRYLAHLPRRTAGLLIAAGALYVGGAAGVEMVGGWYADGNGEENLVYALITTLEELLEMIGLLIALYALLAYARDHRVGDRVVISVGEPDRGEPAPPLSGFSGARPDPLLREGTAER